MIPILATITGVFRNNKLATIATGVVLLLSLLQFKQCSTNQRLKKQLAVAEHNLAAANDTIRYEKNRNGEEMAVKLAFLTDKLANLEELNQDLYAEVKNIKGKVSTIIKTDVQIIHDTVELKVDGTLLNSKVVANFDYSKEFSPGNFRKLKGFTSYDIKTGEAGGELTQDEVGMRYTTGIKNLDKNKPEIFLQSDYPGFKATSLEGAVLDPNLFASKRKVPLITLGIGVGWTPVTYDFQTKKTDINLQRVGVTAGVNINVIKLLKGN